MRCEEVRRYIERDVTKPTPMNYDYAVILRGCDPYRVNCEPLDNLNNIVERCIKENNITRDVYYFSVIDESVNWVIITEY